MVYDISHLQAAGYDVYIDGDKLVIRRSAPGRDLTEKVDDLCHGLSGHAKTIARLGVLDSIQTAELYQTLADARL